MSNVKNLSWCHHQLTPTFYSPEPWEWLAVIHNLLLFSCQLVNELPKPPAWILSENIFSRHIIKTLFPLEHQTGALCLSGAPVAFFLEKKASFQRKDCNSKSSGRAWAVRAVLIIGQHLSVSSLPASLQTWPSAVQLAGSLHSILEHKLTAKSWKWCWEGQARFVLSSVLRLEQAHQPTDTVKRDLAHKTKGLGSTSKRNYW